MNTPSDAGTLSFSWDRKPKEIWKDLSDRDFPPDAPYFPKLALLAQLKIADAIAAYTRWLMILTAVIVVCAFVQAGIGVLTYLRPPAH